MDIQVLDGKTNSGLSDLEGIKFAKFLKRATGSHHMSSALLKTAAAGALVGGAGYYANKKYHWVDKLKNFFSPSVPTKRCVASDGKRCYKWVSIGATTSKKAPVNKGANGWFNADLFRNLASSLLPAPKVEVPQGQVQAQSLQPEPPVKAMLSNPLVLAAAVGAGFLLLKK